MGGKSVRFLAQLRLIQDLLLILWLKSMQQSSTLANAAWSAADKDLHPCLLYTSDAADE